MDIEQQQQQQQQQHEPIDLWGLSEEELEWCWALKIAVEAEEDLKPLSDFEYVHHALYSGENTELALAHVRGLQYFREEYNVNDNAEEGIRLIEGFMNLHPNFLLSVDVDEQWGHYVLIYDYAKRRPNDVKTDEDWRNHLAGMYYLMHCMQNTVHAAREGVVHICECEGMSWDNFNHNGVMRHFSHLYDNYPMKHKEISWLRTPTAANILFGFIKHLLRADASKRFRLGCTFHGYDGRIDEIFLLPNPQVAKQNLIQKMYQFLILRFQAEREFRLPEPDLMMEEDEEEDEEEEEEDDENNSDEDLGGEGVGLLRGLLMGRDRH